MSRSLANIAVSGRVGAPDSKIHTHVILLFISIKCFILISYKIGEKIDMICLLTMEESDLEFLCKDLARGTLIKLRSNVKMMQPNTFDVR